MSTPTQKVQNRSQLLPLIIGHRGARAYAPENTMVGFKKGLESGADWVECDVRLSQDGHVVIIHDNRVDRTTNGIGLVSRLQLNDLKKLDAGHEERIPTLKEFLNWLRLQDVAKAVIEIKSNPESDQKTVEKVVNLILEFNLMDRSRVISFKHSLMVQAKKLCPLLHVGLLYPSQERIFPEKTPIEEAVALHVNSIWPSFQILDPHWVRQAHENQIQVYTWTLNRPQEMVQAIQMGVDGIGSDVPALLRKILDSYLSQEESLAG